MPVAVKTFILPNRKFGPHHCIHRVGLPFFFLALASANFLEEVIVSHPLFSHWKISAAQAQICKLFPASNCSLIPHFGPTFSPPFWGEVVTPQEVVQGEGLRIFFRRFSPTEVFICISLQICSWDLSSGFIRPELSGVKFLGDKSRAKPLLEPRNPPLSYL